MSPLYRGDIYYNRILQPIQLTCFVKNKQFRVLLQQYDSASFSGALAVTRRITDCDCLLGIVIFLRHFPMLFVLTVCFSFRLPLDYATSQLSRWLPSVVRGCLQNSLLLGNYCCWCCSNCAVAVSGVAATA